MPPRELVSNSCRTRLRAHRCAARLRRLVGQAEEVNRVCLTGIYGKSEDARPYWRRTKVAPRTKIRAALNVVLPQTTLIQFDLATNLVGFLVGATRLSSGKQPDLDMLYTAS
jgi:hypothetical protein